MVCVPEATFPGCMIDENKHVEVEGWYSREDAVKEIEASRKRYREDAHN
jgi:inorganic pyrophosphatase